MSRRQYMPQITAGVLLSRTSEVHRDAGGRTACGQRYLSRVAPVSHVQAIVFKLALCVRCYPGHEVAGGRPQT